MSDVSVAQALAGQPGENESVTIKGWVRTRRDSKGVHFVQNVEGA